METWKINKTDWATLIRTLPSLLVQAGDYIYIGMESDCTSYSIARAKIGARDCWIIADTSEDSPAFLMECSMTTDGYVEDIKEWLSDTWCWEWDEPVWVCEKIFGY
jgi:hypothetical protein